MAERIASYAEFWPHYLRAHRDARTRLTHYAGTVAGTALFVAGLGLGDWPLIVAAPVVGYAAAFSAHFVFEGNRPATFGHPLWSFYSDFRMLALCASGRLGPELARAEAKETRR